MRIERIEPTSRLEELKDQYLQQTTAPLDGMWLYGFVPIAEHYGFHAGEDLVGFCCVNAQGYLLQFFVSGPHRHRASQVFASLLEGEGGPCGEIHGAFVSTAEPQYLSLCLDQLPIFEVNALMYERGHGPVGSTDEQGTGVPPMAALEESQRATAVAFAVETIGAHEDWLSEYYENLIGRGELFGVWDGDRLIAIGENRGREGYRSDCVDLGVIVAPSERGKGIATEVLRRLAAVNDERGSMSICSTERGNVAARKAIERAGFFAPNRILRFSVRQET